MTAVDQDTYMVSTLTFSGEQEILSSNAYGFFNNFLPIFLITCVCSVQGCFAPCSKLTVSNLLCSPLSRFQLQFRLPSGRKACPLQGYTWPPPGRECTVPKVGIVCVSEMGLETVCAKELPPPVSSLVPECKPLLQDVKEWQKNLPGHYCHESVMNVKKFMTLPSLNYRYRKYFEYAV